jgi:hypothetical protein
MTARPRIAASFAALLLATGFAAGSAPLRAQAQDAASFARRVDIADVVFRDGIPYDRDGRFRSRDRLVVLRDRYGRAVYYRNVPAPRPRDDRMEDSRLVSCDGRGRCGPARGVD